MSAMFDDINLQLVAANTTVQTVAFTMPPEYWIVDPEGGPSALSPEGVEWQATHNEILAAKGSVADKTAASTTSLTAGASEGSKNLVNKITGNQKAAQLMKKSGIPGVEDLAGCTATLLDTVKSISPTTKATVEGQAGGVVDKSATLQGGVKTVAELQAELVKINQIYTALTELNDGYNAKIQEGLAAATGMLSFISDSALAQRLTAIAGNPCLRSIATSAGVENIPEAPPPLALESKLSGLPTFKLPAAPKVPVIPVLPTQPPPVLAPTLELPGTVGVSFLAPPTGHDALLALLEQEYAAGLIIVDVYNARKTKLLKVQQHYLLFAAKGPVSNIHIDCAYWVGSKWWYTGQKYKYGKNFRYQPNYGWVFVDN